LADAPEVAKQDDGREQGDEDGVQQKHFGGFSLACMCGLCPIVCFLQWEFRRVCSDLPFVTRKRFAWDDCKVKTRNRTVLRVIGKEKRTSLSKTQTDIEKPRCRGSTAARLG
jgi:hypothetical protein